MGAKAMTIREWLACCLFSGACMLGAAASPLPPWEYQPTTDSTVVPRPPQVVAYTGPPLARPDDDAIALAAHQRLWGDTRHSLAWPIEEVWADDGRSVTIRARVGAGWGLADRPIGPRLVFVCLDATAPRLRYREVAYLPPGRRPTPAKPRLAWEVALPEWAARPCFGGLWWGTGRAPGRPGAPEWAGGVAWVGEEPKEAR